MLTTLLVDDDGMILRLCHCVLQEIPGNRILDAQAGREALDLAVRHEGAIDLLITDVCMPGELDGIELAERLQKARPTTTVLLMSGYPPEPFRLRESWHFLAKPFSPTTLAARVEEAMGRTLWPTAHGSWRFLNPRKHSSISR